MTSDRQPRSVRQINGEPQFPAVAYLCVALLPLLGYCVWLWFNAPRLPWQGQVFASADLTGPLKHLRAFELRQRSKKRPPVRGLNPKRFSARWVTCLVQEQEQSVTFHLAADDGARLRVGKAMLLEHWRDGRMSAGKTAVLKPGLHRIEVEHYQQGGVALLQLNVGWDGAAPGPIPPERLRAPRGPNMRCK